MAAARLYLCTGFRPDLAEFVDAALAGGVDIVQLRDKGAEARAELAALEVIGEACARYGALLSVNDRADVALAAGADILHLGQDDLPVPWARRVLGDHVVIGRSTHDLAQANTAAHRAGGGLLLHGPVLADTHETGSHGTGPRPGQGHGGGPPAAPVVRHRGNRREAAAGGARSGRGPGGGGPRDHRGGRPESRGATAAGRALTKSMRRSRSALLIALGTDNFGSGLFLPLALVYVVRVVGLPLGVAGTVVAVGTLAGLAAPPLAGRLVDRLGPRTVVIGAQLLQAAGALVYLAANGAAATCVAAILLAAGQQSFYSALFALIADVSPPGPKDRSFAQVNMIRSGAFGAGALAAGILLIGTDDGGLRLAVTLNAVSFCVSAALLYWYVHDHHHHASAGTTSSDAPGVLRDRPYLALIVFTGLVVLPVDFFLVGVPVFALERLHTPEWVPGAILAVVTVIDSTCGTLAVRLTRQLSRPGAMMIGAALYVAWCLVSALAVVVPAAWQPGWLLAAALLLAAGTLMFMPRANALSEAAAPAASRGRYLAAFQFSFTIPGVAAPALVALFSIGDLAPWPVLAVAAAVGLLGLRWLAPKLPTQATLAK